MTSSGQKCRRPSSAQISDTATPTTPAHDRPCSRAIADGPRSGRDRAVQSSASADADEPRAKPTQRGQTVAEAGHDPDERRDRDAAAGEPAASIAAPRPMRAAVGAVDRGVRPLITVGASAARGTVLGVTHRHRRHARRPRAARRAPRDAQAALARAASPRPAGRSPRTIVASIRIAAARPTPSCFISSSRSVAKIANTATITSAALVTVPAGRGDALGGRLAGASARSAAPRGSARARGSCSPSRARTGSRTANSGIQVTIAPVDVKPSSSSAQRVLEDRRQHAVGGADRQQVQRDHAPAPAAASGTRRAAAGTRAPSTKPMTSGVASLQRGR